jgi:hypothetical protein
MQPPILANVAAVAVTALYYLWRSHYQTRRQRERLLRERVTYMLWVMAGRVGSPDPGLTLPGGG